jgi:hypothetical protein
VVEQSGGAQACGHHSGAMPRVVGRGERPLRDLGAADGSRNMDHALCDAVEDEPVSEPVHPVAGVGARQIGPEQRLGRDVATAIADIEVMAAVADRRIGGVDAIDRQRIPERHEDDGVLAVDQLRQHL